MNQNNIEACVFCELLKGNDQSLIAYRDNTTAVFPSLHQRETNLGHMLVIPAQHIPSIYELPKQTGAELIDTVSRVARAVKAAFSADGIAIKQHNDPCGGQDVFHLHIHVFPCFKDDGFFRGPDRWPHGLHQRPLEERLEQTRKVKEALALL